jgi:hypothetical protein
MLIQIEFFRRTHAEPEGCLIRRNRGQFSGEKDAEVYGLKYGPEEADGFRILVNGAVRRIVSSRSRDSN